MNTALPLHAIIKIPFDRTDHLSDSRYHGGDPVPTGAPTNRPEQHNQPIKEHDTQDTLVFGGNKFLVRVFLPPFFAGLARTGSCREKRNQVLQQSCAHKKT
jgi:hypothetical protein